MDLFELAAKLSLDSKDYEKGIDDAEKKTKTFSEKLKSGLGTAAKVTAKAFEASFAAITASATAATAATVKLAKDSVNAFADYEQLVGGVETLFGDSAGTVLANSEKAFKSAGMSMNEYMETSIQSAASLINSLGGDQKKAAQLMDMSITDMSDNVNKMGTSMEAVQNAYRGFSRGNFTMLDNLALGFAGSKEGMEELIEKAEELSGIEYDISSYSDIVEAIHVVQTEMGITGTTAKEASATISGSLASMRSAWTNLVAGLANKDADIGALTSQFVDSVMTMADNIIPAAQTAVKNVGELVRNLAPVIAKEFPRVVGRLLPVLLNAVGSILDAIQTSILSGNNLNRIVGTIAQIVVKLSEAAIKALPKLAKTVTDIVKKLAQVLSKNIKPMLDSAVLAISEIVKVITQNAGPLLEAIGSVLMELANAVTDPTVISSLISAGVEVLTFIMDGLSTGLPRVIPTLITVMTSLVDSIVTALSDNFPVLLQGAVDLFMALIDAIPTVLTTLLDSIQTLVQSLSTALTDNLPLFLDAAIQLFTALVNAIPEVLTLLMDSMGELVETLSSTLIENLPVLFDGAIQLLMALVDAIPEINKVLAQQAPEIITKIVAALMDNFPVLLQGAVDLFMALVKAIPIVLASLRDALRDLINEFARSFTGPLTEKFDEMWGEVERIFSEAWRAIAKTASRAWETISGIWKNASEWFNKTVIRPIGGFFSDIWNALKTGAADAWEGIKTVFSVIPKWFSNVFTDAWSGVKKVFETGGRIFEGMKEGIVEAFKSVVNAIIRGINKVIKIPFDGINAALRKIRNVEILGIEPFSWISTISVPQIPELARGGILKRGQIGLLEGSGAEAVVPLERNTEWTSRVAEQIANDMGTNNTGILSDIRATLDAILANMGTEIVLSDGVIAGRVDRILGQTAVRKGRGN